MFFKVKLNAQVLNVLKYEDPKIKTLTKMNLTSKIVQKILTVIHSE